MDTKRNRNNTRSEKIASKVQTIVAEILRDKYSDDAILSGVSLVGAESHGGLQFVKIYFYSRSDANTTQTKLNAVSKNIRYELGARMNQKYVPEIQFEYDDTMERAERIDNLLKNL
ncbi:MAG: 30S ribosome-binding factor RbfA [Alphaproteobacteria bacterium]